MKTHTGRWGLGASALLALTLLHTGCNRIPLNPDNKPTHANPLQPLALEEIHHIIWTLDEANFESLQLIFNEHQFFGYDGCNWFGGRIAVEDERLIPSQVVQTERACNVRVYSIGPLASPFSIRPGKGELRLFTEGGTLLFKSGVDAPVADSPLVGNWLMTASNDPEFAHLQQQNLLPAVTLTADRQFKAAWFCTDENPFGCDEVSGIFGIGKKGEMEFYRSGWQNHAAGAEFVGRMLEATTYRLEERGLKSRALILVNNGGTRYEFISATR